MNQKIKTLRDILSTEGLTTRMVLVLVNAVLAIVNVVFFFITHAPEHMMVAAINAAAVTLTMKAMADNYFNNRSHDA